MPVNVKAEDIFVEAVFRLAVAHNKTRVNYAATYLAVIFDSAINDIADRRKHEPMFLRIQYFKTILHLRTRGHTFGLEIASQQILTESGRIGGQKTNGIEHAPNILCSFDNFEPLSKVYEKAFYIRGEATRRAAYATNVSGRGHSELQKISIKFIGLIQIRALETGK